MAQEMAELGFTHIELSHGIRITLVPGLLKAVEEGIVKISSTHNFCPLPTGVVGAAPNLFEPSSMDPRERDQWIRHTKRSLDFASQVGSGVLVCHLGSAKFLLFPPGRKLHPPADPKVPLTEEQVKERSVKVERALAKLRKRMPDYWAHTLASIGEILEYAAEKGVRLGFENREKFEELPVDADFPSFLAGLPGPPVASYWHDTGHAQIKADNGVIDHRLQLTENAANTAGFHLHDVDAEGHDHQPIGSGRIDFKMVSQFWRPEHRLVIELSPRVSPADVLASKRQVEALIESAGISKE